MDEVETTDTTTATTETTTEAPAEKEATPPSTTTTTEQRDTGDADTDGVADAVEEAPQEVPEWLRIFADTREERPDWFNALDEVKAREGIEHFEGIDPSSLPIEAQQLVHNLQGVVTRAAQKSADTRQQFEAAKAALEEERTAMVQERAELYKLFNDDRFKQFLDVGEVDPNLDPYSPEGQQAQVKKAMAEWFGEFAKAFSDQSDAIQESVREKLAEREHAARLDALKQFVAEHDDFNDYYDDIKAYKEQHPTVAPQDIYWMLKAKAGKVAPKPRKQVRQAARLGSQSQSRPGGSRKAGVGGLPKVADAQAIARAVKAHPDAAKAAGEKLSKTRCSY
jgi:hypothetical protein